MKKLLFVFVMVMMLAVSVQSSEALVVSQEAFFPDGNIALYLDAFEFAYGGLHMPINLYNDGTLSAVVLDPDGFAVLHLYMEVDGFIYCSTDGFNWADCSAF